MREGLIGSAGEVRATGEGSERGPVKEVKGNRGPGAGRGKVIRMASWWPDTGNPV